MNFFSARGSSRPLSLANSARFFLSATPNCIIPRSLWYTRRRLLLALSDAAAAVGKSFRARRAGEWASRYCC